MDKINKNRKGIVFGLMTEEEQECLKKQEKVMYYSVDGDWVKPANWLTANSHAWWRNTVYWCPDWDMPTGKDLVGKLCFYDNEHLGICESHYNGSNGIGYFIKGTWRFNVRLATKEEALSLITCKENRTDEI